MERAPSDLHTGTSSSSIGTVRSSAGRKRKGVPSPSRDDRADWHDAAAGRFLSGELAANSCLDMIAKAQKAAGQGCEDLAKAGKSGKLKKNVARDLRRKLRKKSHWPQFYWAQIPIWDAKTETTSMKWHPFLLPHEWLLKFHAFGLTERSAH